jgi:hypothetical protein
VPPARPWTWGNEAGAKPKWLCVLSGTLPATSGILLVKYAELLKRYVSQLTFNRVTKFRASAAARPDGGRGGIRTCGDQKIATRSGASGTRISTSGASLSQAINKPHQASLSSARRQHRGHGAAGHKSASACLSACWGIRPACLGFLLAAFKFSVPSRGHDGARLRVDSHRPVEAAKKRLSDPVQPGMALAAHHKIPSRCRALRLLDM